MAVDSEKARAESVQKHAAQQRAKEEARRQARKDAAKSQVSLIVHGPVRT